MSGLYKNMRKNIIVDRLIRTNNIGLIDVIAGLRDSEDIVAKLRQEGITRQRDLVRICLDMISYGKGSFVAKNIRSFQIINQNELVKICDRLIDVKLGHLLMDNFDKFGISKEKERFNIAIKLIEDGLGFRLIDNLEKFKIVNECTKVNLIMNIMEYKGCRLTPYMVKNLEKFNLKFCQSRQNLANKLIDIKCSDLLIDNIVKFGIKKESELMVLIDRLIEEKFGSMLIENIENFNIDLSKRGFSIAKKLVNGNGYKLIYNIKKFKISKEEDRLYIARQLIKGYMYTFIENIDLFEISNKCELLEEFAIRDKKDTCLLKTGLDRYEQRIFNINRLFNVILFKKNIDLDMISLYKNSIDIIADTKLQEDEVELYEETLKNIDKLKDYCNRGEINFDLNKILGDKNGSAIMDALDSVEERRKVELKEIIEKFLFVYTNVSMENEDELTKLITEIIVVKDSQLKKDLLPIVAKFINNGNLGKIKEEQKYNLKKKSFPAINAVIFDRLQLYEEENKEVLSKMRKAFDNSNFLRNSIAVSETFRKIIKLDSLQIEGSKVIDVINFLANRPKNMCKNIGYILDIIVLKGEDLVDNMSKNFDERELRMLFYRTYSEFLKMDGDLEFVNNYESFTNRSDNIERNLGEYILKYVADNSRDAHVMSEVRKFISTMHDIKKFRNYKYDISTDKHLRYIKSIDSEVYTKWTIKHHEFECISEGSKAKITDDPVDLFLIGTEVDGSCQSVKGRKELNKCLIGIIGDGKNKAVVVKENNRIIARCIVRLLIDQDTNNIVMVREKMYKVNGVSSGMIFKLNEECIKYAKWLGVSLVCEDLDALINHEMLLVSKGGHAKYEYVDVARRLFDTYGEYVVKNDRLVYLYRV